MSPGSGLAIRYLDGHRLRAALLAGTARVSAACDYLNRINVYPVADGDTGTNLALTLGHLGDALADAGQPAAGALLQEAADAMLEGARGNSGAILAQYLLGLAGALAGCQRVSTRQWCAALEVAATQARSAVEVPAAGTMLSVMDALAASARNSPAVDFLALLDTLLVSARQALAATRDELPANRAAGTEDAGASGFCLLLEGIADLVHGREAAPARAGSEQLPGEVLHLSAGDGAPLRFRYCTECIISGEALDRSQLRQELGALGDSIVVIGHGQRVRIHAHVNEPGRLFALAAGHGQPSAEKVDDMWRQQQTLAARQAVAIVTDSGADLPAAVWDELCIHMVPLRVNFGSRSYLDKSALGSEEFLRLLDETAVHPQTSQPAPADYRRLYEFLGAHHSEVITVSLTSQLSGTFQAASAAARQAGSTERFPVVDSANLSLGQGLIVMAGAECARAGGSAAEVLAAIHAAAATTRCFGLVSDLRYAVRGGRIGRRQQQLAGLFGITPIIGVTRDGRIATRRLLPRWRDPVGGLVQLARSEMRPAGRWRINVGHAARPELAARLAEGCAELPGVESVLLTALGPTLGVHGGPGTLGLALQRLGS